MLWKTMNSGWWTQTMKSDLVDFVPFFLIFLSSSTSRYFKKHEEINLNFKHAPFWNEYNFQ